MLRYIMARITNQGDLSIASKNCSIKSLIMKTALTVTLMMLGLVSCNLTTEQEAKIRDIIEIIEAK